MSLAQDLLAQARFLATKEPKRPRQASLRRAVSAGYYALFHLLVEAGAKTLAPRNPPNLRARVRRALRHGEMKSVCQQFQQKKLTPAISKLIAQPIERQLVAVADAFVELQEARHSADYDTLTPFDKADVLQKLSMVEKAFADWDAVKNGPNAAVFLAALLLHQRWQAP